MATKLNIESDCLFGLFKRTTLSGFFKQPTTQFCEIIHRKNKSKEQCEIVSLSSPQMLGKARKDCVAHDIRMKLNRIGLASRLPFLSLSVVGLFPFLVGYSAHAQDLPIGGVIVAGDASLETTDNILNVNQNSQRAAIDWRSFSVGTGKTVNFNQPSSSSVILNRVVGNEKSIISGALNANGQVFLSNSNGLIFTKGAEVNVGGLVASSLDISNEDFMAGNTTFVDNGSAQSVINLGKLQAGDTGYVALLGNQVRNEGLVVAKLGAAVLAAGERVTLNFNDDSLVGVTIDKGALESLVENGNAVHADGGLVVLTARGVDDVLSGVVNNTGEVRAQTISQREGRIFLLGDMASGEVNVGGNLDASAPSIGNGGFIETSAAHVNVADDVQISTKSANSQNGEWLIDPVDFTIAAAAGDITGATLASLLDNGNVTIETAHGVDTVNALFGTAGTNGDIIVDDVISKTSAVDTTLTLKADRHIVFNSGSKILSQNGPLNVYLSANNSQAASSDIIFNSDNEINTHGGDLIIGGKLTNSLPSDGSKVKLILGKYPSSIQTYYPPENGYYWVSQVTFNTPVKLDAGAGNITVNGDKVETNGTVEINANNVKFDLSDDFNGYSGLSVNANFADFSADDYLYFAGYYPEYNINTPNHIMSSAVSPPNTTSFNIANELRFSAVNDVGFEWASINMTGQSNNVLSFTGDRWYGYGLSVNFEGSPDLTFALGQKSTEAAAFPIGQSLETYMNTNNYDIYTAARELKIPYEAFNYFSLDGAAYKIKMYSDGNFNVVTPKVFDNGHLAFGNGLSDSITNFYNANLKNTNSHKRPSEAPGQLGQPFFFDDAVKRWFPITYSNQPLDVAIGYGGVSTNNWNTDGYTLRGVALNDQISNFNLDYSDFKNGQGIITASYDVNLVDAGLNSIGAVNVQNVYELFAGDALMKNTTAIKNITNNNLSNVRFWVGTTDDWVGMSDKTIKIEGNLVESGGNIGFQYLDDGDNDYTDGDEQARAIVVTEYDPTDNRFPNYDGKAILMYSTNNNAHMVTGTNGANFADIILDDPLDPAWYYYRNDAAYSSFVSLKDIPASDAAAVDWYYGAAKVTAAKGFNDVDRLAQRIAADGGLQIRDGQSLYAEFRADQLARAAKKAADEAAKKAADEAAKKATDEVISVELGKKHIPYSKISSESDEPNDIFVYGLNNSNFNYSEVSGFSLSGTARADRASSMVSLADAAKILQSDSVVGTSTSTGPTAPFSNEVRVHASRGSLVDIVNGGVRLPDGVDQQIILTTDDEG